MSEDPNLIPVTEIRRTGHSCGCGEHDPERLTLDARAIPHRLRHAAVIGAVSSLLLVQIDQQLPMTFQHTLLEAEDGYARVEILRTA